MSVLVFYRKIVSVIMDHRYRPELHYMRGPGPKWFEKHGRSSVQASRSVGRGHRRPQLYNPKQCLASAAGPRQDRRRRGMNAA
jgi:hypothetical protein